MPGGSEENPENLNRDSQSPVCDLNPGPPYYEAELLTLRPRCSVKPVALLEFIISVVDSTLDGGICPLVFRLVANISGITKYAQPF